jgi:nicotinate phosphoribosyltransferase
MQEALLTDLYELTMVDAYLAEGMEEEAAFSLFVRQLPRRRNYLLACGLEQVLRYLEALSFDPQALAYLESLRLFTPRLLGWLEGFRFTGSVHAVAEGTPVFGGEPLLEVEAPLPQAQLVETYILNQVHLQTLVASKAVRVVEAAAGRPVVDFGARRMHGLDASVQGARAEWVAGVGATSNLLAGQRYGLPVAGTQAHSYVQAHASEQQAFTAWVQSFPETTLLVDTYDTLAGVEQVVRLARELGPAFRVRAVRLDSGDLEALSRQARQRLDEVGLRQVQVFASGGLDEEAVARLVASGAPIAGFGVGTAMGVSADVPALDMAYKLVEYAGRGRMKLSAGKVLLPGRKQVFREEEAGVALRDTLARRGEELPGRALLQPVMHQGRVVAGALPTLEQVRARAREEVARLPAALRRLEPAEPPYPVSPSRRLRQEQERLAAERSAGPPGLR